jgi:hypothetical protein
MLTFRIRSDSTRFTLFDPLHLPIPLHRFNLFNPFNPITTASRVDPAGIGAGPSP